MALEWMNSSFVLVSSGDWSRRSTSLSSDMEWLSFFASFMRELDRLFAGFSLSSFCSGTLIPQMSVPPEHP